MAVLMDDTHLEAERYLVRRWGLQSGLQVRDLLNQAWRTGQFLLSSQKIEEAMDTFQVTQLVLDVLTTLQVPYLVGGSVASSLYGEARFTQDTDVVTQLQDRHITPLIRALESDFYVSESAAREACQRRSSFNLIHFSSNYKVDIFVWKARPFDLSRFQRRQVPAGFAPNFYVSSAEDMVLAKLQWYNLGQGLSDRQWRDILAILAVQNRQLDFAYLRHWAQELQLDQLLERALGDVAPLTDE